jgi:mRNA interferase HigB
VHIISLRVLREFWQKHSAAEHPMRTWHTVMEKAEFADFHELRRTFGSVDYAKPYTIFDVGGNKWRIIAAIHYNVRKVHIRWVLTHSEYTDWCQAHRHK